MANTGFAGPVTRLNTFPQSASAQLRAASSRANPALVIAGPCAGRGRQQRRWQWEQRQVVVWCGLQGRQQRHVRGRRVDWLYVQGLWALLK